MRVKILKVSHVINSNLLSVDAEIEGNQVAFGVLKTFTQAELMNYIKTNVIPEIQFLIKPLPTGWLREFDV